MEHSLPILRNLLAGSKQTKITVVRIISHWVNSQTFVLPNTKQEYKSLLVKWFSFKLRNNHSYSYKWISRQMTQ